MQQVISGENIIQLAAAEIKKRNYQSVFLVTGKHLASELPPDFLKGLMSNHFIKEGPNVEEAEINQALDSFRPAPADVIMAIGGGSVMDLAKAVIYYNLPATPFFIAAPTTIGSGSEATHFAVIYKDKQKKSLAHVALMPSIVMLDSQLVSNLPRYLAAVSGMDSFAQAVESYWSVNATDDSREDAVEAIQLWKENYVSAVEGSSVARSQMMLAAYKAGKAINVTRTTGPHALSYYLTANFGMPHGQAVALFLPLFFLYNHPTGDLLKFLKVENDEAAMDFIHGIMKQVGLVTKLEELKINKQIIVDDLLNEVNEERFANNPVAFNKERLKELILIHL